MLYAETSTDGQNWTRSGERFKSKAEAKTWFDAKLPDLSAYEWRTGFIALAWGGIFYRVVHPNGKIVRG